MSALAVLATVAVLTAACLALAPAHAQQRQPDSQLQPESCQAPGQIPERRRIRREGPIPMDIRANEMDARGRDAPMRFFGNVELVYGDQRLETDELIYNRASGRIELPGWLRYTDAVLRLEADSAFYETEHSSGRFDGVRYYVAGAEGAGHARVVEMLGPTTARVEGFDFTTCDIDDPDWQLKAGRVHLDFESGTGTARNARLDFKGVPILYTPWLSFPLDGRRKSGFLYPSLGIDSEDGLDLSVPYYINIAPNQDATVTARWIQDRGAMLGSEYRILTRRQAGQVNIDWLPGDRKADRDRYFGQLDYRARLAPRWQVSADLNRASDDQYFIDLGGELSDSAVQFLRSDARITGRGRHWTFSTLVDTFQVLDEAVEPGREPYNRLPRMEFVGDWPLPGRFSFRLDTEAVYFDRADGVTGARLDALPELSWNLLRPGWFFRPAAGLRATTWALDDAPGNDDNPSRAMPVISLDAGLIFERAAASRRRQTLEPRIFYLYVPFRDQQELPRFDTSELTFGFARLFQTNRFTGPDRQGDANQLTTALTTRLIDDRDGSSILDASVGQIFFFEDQAVQLPGVAEDERNFSATVAEVNWRPVHRFLLNAGLQYDFEDNETQVAAVGLTFRGRRDRQVGIGYRYRRGQVDQVDIRARYPLTRNLNLIGRFNYSFEESRALEMLGGLEYESCCWAIRTTLRRFIRDREAETRTAVFVELHLKGLGSLGRRPYPLFDN